MGSRKSRTGSRQTDLSAVISRDDLLAYLRAQPDRAAGFRHILDDFDAGRTDRKQIREALDELVREGRITRHKGNRYEAAPALVRYSGRIHLHRDGYGFVTPETPPPGVAGDVFIPPPATGTAMDGDRVFFAVVDAGAAEGRVLGIGERAHTRVVGQLRFDGQVYFLSPADDRLPEKIIVGGDVSEHKDKLVEIELTRFGSEDHWPAGEIVSVIGFLDDPDIETTVIMRKYGLDAGFPEAVEAETAGLPAELTEEDLAGRSDFRDRESITIDPATARDFDDAVDVRELDGGRFEVGVHIADVAHFVRRGSPTDLEARKRGCSVYFPDRVVPMLPERLSNDICSLNAGTDRLSTSVILVIDATGRVAGSDFHQGVIRSRERMNYEAVQKILDGDPPARRKHHRIVGSIKILARVARLLEARRRDRGTIDFDLPEPELTYDEAGAFTGIGKSPRYFAHRLIEELMIAANEAAARLIEGKIRSGIFRIHEPPDPERVAGLSETLGEMGVRFRPKDAGPGAFQQLLTSIEGRPDARMIASLVLRSFRQAVYSTRNLGHFGLASRCYTHFTSPIRRYPDLVVHRLLKAWLSDRRHGYILADLESVALESSHRERISEAAERDLLEWKRMILLEGHLGDTLEAIVIHVFPKGMRVELADYFIEGYISVEDMSDDYYDFHARARALVGRGTRRRYAPGQRLRVQVARIDKLLGRAYFLPV